MLKITQNPDYKKYKDVTKAVKEKSGILSMPYST